MATKYRHRKSKKTFPAAIGLIPWTYKSDPQIGWEMKNLIGQGCESCLHQAWIDKR